MQKTEARLRRGTLPRAIAMALGIGSAATASAQTVATNELEEVVVTATRRTENLQDVPITIQALTGATLAQLNVQTFEDFVKYLPNVSMAGTGPGQDEVYMRGLSTTHQGEQVAGGTAVFPNVAVYLDDQSVQLPGRNLDVYAADLERIEVLEGPQGTLYGAGAQAGAIRYITNKPKLDVTEGSVNASYSTTAHGDPSSSGVAMINIPLIPDTLAVRAVIYDDSRGGYIHNIPGTFTRSPTDLGIAQYFGGVVPAGSQSLSNSALVSNAFNPVTYKGVRVSGFYKFNDDWNFLLEQSYQSMEADGVFAYNPELGDLDVQQYNRGYKQTAAFGEVAFDIVPHSLTLTVGTRFFRFDNFDSGQSDSVSGCRNFNPCTPANGIFDPFNFSQVNSGHKSKVNLRVGIPHYGRLWNSPRRRSISESGREFTRSKATRWSSNESGTTASSAIWCSALWLKERYRKCPLY